jgi:outer membrane usher protein
LAQGALDGAGKQPSRRLRASFGCVALIQSEQTNGDAIPFGAEVLDVNGQSIGVLGQGGQLFVRGAEEGGTLQVRWGEGEAKQCKLGYQLPARGKWASAEVESTDAVCRQGSYP